jgi:hypothetical protein
MLPLRGATVEYAGYTFVRDEPPRRVRVRSAAR